MDWVYIVAGVLLLILVAGLFSNRTVVITDFSSNPNKKATVYYYLPESILKIRATAKAAVVYNPDNTLSDSSKIIEETFAITAEIIADTKDLLSLNYIPNPFMSDEIKYGVNAKGLLETVHITTEDRTAVIISTLASATQVVLKPTIDVEEVARPVVMIKEFTADFTIRASILSSTAQTINWKLLLFNEQGINESPISRDADFKISTTDATAPIPTLSSLIHGSSPSTHTATEGILTRPLNNISLWIESALPGVKFSSTVMIADTTKLIVIPIRRTPFVKRINKVAIQDGIIISNEINNPSSVEGFISIPINIAKAIISIPAQLIQFKFDNTKLRTNLLEEEKKQIAAKKELDEIKKQIEELKKK